MSTASFTNTNSGTGAPLLSGTAAGRVDSGGSVAPPVFSAAGAVGNGGTAKAAYLAGTAHARAVLAVRIPGDVLHVSRPGDTLRVTFPRDTWKEPPHA